MTLKGVMSAVATPLDHEQKVAEARLRALVDSTIDAGVHGLVPCGSTGEFAHLSADERRRVLEIVLDQTAGRVPVVPQTGALSTAEAVDLSTHAERAGAAAVMAVAPFYDALDLNETSDYFRTIADAVGIPVMIYNLPLATGVNLTPEDLASIAGTAENIQYVKDTSGDYNQVTRLVHEYADVITTFIGWDTMLLAAFVEGVAGSIIGATNFIGRQLVAVYDAVQAGDLATARAEWSGIYPVLRFLVSGGYVGGVKGAFAALGDPIGSPRAPVAELTDGRRAELESIVRTLGLDGSVL